MTDSDWLQVAARRAEERLRSTPNNLLGLAGRRLMDALPAGVSTLVQWGWDCIDCEGSFGANDRCDSCGGTNRIPVYVTRDDAERFDAALAGAEGSTT